MSVKSALMNGNNYEFKILTELLFQLELGQI